MLISRKAPRGAAGDQGRSAVGLAELRTKLCTPSSLGDGHRQRLLELAQRLARVQALGDEYARVAFSPMAADATERLTASV